MNLRNYLFLVFWIMTPIMTAQCQQPDDFCQYFYDQLKEIPHEKLDLRRGVITFSWDNKEYHGCEITFVTNDSLRTNTPSLPRFTRVPDPTLEKKGWRHNINYDADGPGTSLYGVERGDTLCLISYAQPATLVEPGNIEWESTITVWVQCRVKEE